MMVDDVVGIPSNHLSGIVRADSGDPGVLSRLLRFSMLSLRLERQCRRFWRTVTLSYFVDAPSPNGASPQILSSELRFWLTGRVLALPYSYKKVSDF